MINDKDPDRATALFALAAIAASREPVTPHAAYRVLMDLILAFVGHYAWREVNALARVILVSPEPLVGLALLADVTVVAYGRPALIPPLRELAALLRRPAPGVCCEGSGSHST